MDKILTGLVLFLILGVNVYASKEILESKQKNLNYLSQEIASINNSLMIKKDFLDLANSEMQTVTLKVNFDGKFLIQVEDNYRKTKKEYFFNEKETLKIKKILLENI